MFRQVQKENWNQYTVGNAEINLLTDRKLEYLLGNKI